METAGDGEEASGQDAGGGRVQTQGRCCAGLLCPDDRCFDVFLLSLLWSLKFEICKKNKIKLAWHFYNYDANGMDSTLSV